MLETMKRILTMAGKYRHKVTIGIIISLLHSFFSAMDLFAILYISFSINTLTQQKIGVAAAILLVGLTGKIICKYQITEHISGSSYDVFYEKRLEAGEKLKRVPMGYFSEKNLGEIQMAMTTDMNALESSAMSVVENILGSLIYAAVCTLVLLLFNWRIGLITLAGLGIGILLLRVVQENAKKVMPVRFQAQEEMTEKTLEFIQGNMVMRLFGTGRDGLNRVKEAFHAIELLEAALKRKRSKCMLGTGSMTDPYIPIERKIGNVRKALELAERYGYGFSLITKSDLILHDLDLLKSINEKTKCVIQMTLTTYDEGLCKKIEPNVCTTKARFEVLKELRRIGIPTVVWLCPILPFINDTEENIKGILNYCSEAEVYGIICFGMGLTLREGSREYFFRQLDHLFPGMKEKYLQTYGMQYQIVSNKNDELMQLFHHTCEKNGIVHDNRKIFEYLSTFETKCDNVQLSLFDKDFAGKSPNGI